MTTPDRAGKPDLVGLYDLLVYQQSMAASDNYDVVAFEFGLASILQQLDAVDRVAPPEMRRFANLTIGTIYQHRRVGGLHVNMERARHHLGVALEVAESAGLSTTAILHNLAVVTKNDGPGSQADNLEAAIGYLERALQQTPLAESPDAWATTASQLGNTYSERVIGDQADNAERALDLHRRALALRPRHDQPVRWAISMHNLGSTLLTRSSGSRVANLREARRLLEQALEVRTERDLPHHFALTQGSLADCYSGLARLEPDEAEGHLQAAIACLEAVGRVWPLEADRHRWVNNRLRLAGTHLERGGRGHPEAHDSAIAIAEQVLLSVSMDTDLRNATMAHEHLARGLIARGGEGDHARATEHLAVIADAAERMGDTEVVAGSSARLGTWLARAGRWEEAAAAFARALEAESDIGIAAISVSTQRALLRAGGFHLDAAYAFARSSSHTWADVLVTLERGRARLLGETLTREHADLKVLEQLGREDDNAARAAAEFADAARELRAADAAEVAGGGLGIEPVAAPLRVAARAARERLNRAVAAIRTFRGMNAFLAEPDIRTIMRVVTPDRPIVYAFTTEHGGFAVALYEWSPGRHDMRVKRLPLAAKDVDKALLPDLDTGFPGLLVSHELGEDAAAEVLDIVLDYLRPTVAQPLAALLHEIGASSATLVPCGKLGNLPLAAAPLDVGRTVRLLDRVAFQIAPAARVTTTGADADDSGGGDHYLGVADTSPGADLPWAGAEVAWVAERGAGSRLLLGSAARTDDVLAALPGSDVVHFACHGVFDLTAPERSRLELADGALTVADLMATSALRGVRLALASACDTGGSDVSSLSDEVTGLPAALLMAGARATVGALWPVGDLPAALLMSRLASRCLVPTADPARELAASQAWLRDLSVEDAMRQARALIAHASPAHTEILLDELAQLELGSGKRPFQHPLHWAPYVLFSAGRAQPARARPAGPSLTDA